VPGTGNGGGGGGSSGGACEGTSGDGATRVASDVRFILGLDEIGIIGICEGGSMALSTVSSLEEESFPPIFEEMIGVAYVGVGETGTVRGAEVFSVVPRTDPSAGEGRFCITFNKSLLVLTAAVWIMGAWCARFGRMAVISRGVKCTMTSGAKPRNSASHRKAVDSCISSSRIQLVSQTIELSRATHVGDQVVG